MTDETIVKPWTLKVDFRGEVRRFKGWPTDDSEPTFESLLDKCSALFDDLPADRKISSLQYRDDEGDMCLLSSETLPDALTLAEDSRVLRLTLCTEIAQAEQVGPFEQDLSQDRAEAEHVPEATQPASERPSQASSSRFESAKPRVARGFQHFKEQVQNDFHTSQKDMREAFGARSSEPGAGVQLAGTAAGLMTACRLLPVRATRLAAHSLDAIAQSPTHSNQDATGGSQRAGLEERPAEDGDQINHFKQQVVGDFETARKEVKAVFGYIMPPAAAANSSTAAANAQNNNLKETIPDLVGAVCGTSVAFSLLPLRAARLAIAKAAGSPQLGETSTSQDGMRWLQ
eukprot:CAMPEP_0197637676 /NCGR_PEP_ID=MMETSP1338-20131121/12827_1 /TAXON_ID=43686 ORGANISM="Pelagodinium beii, Strain RCC1491" /NCGR_SAMPLE_ID=MMETSP1338 /ASSEMBLY_ACC=CAM_ASM_000754 /LENGTH=343 /DNA_ID=CAMNT_0043210125 /DNA_START=56 /DNA_END=1087 /DNA_ORIENTATION=-